jgi:hypothetical protein
VCLIIHLSARILNLNEFFDFVERSSLSYFEIHLRRNLEVEDSEIPNDELIEIVLRELYIGLEYIPKRAIPMKKYFMKQV